MNASLGNDMNRSRDSMRIGFFGDMGFSPEHSDSHEKYGASFLHAEVKHLFEDCDLVVGNLECSISSVNLSGMTQADLYTSPSVLNSLKQQGNIHLCLANNHIADYGDGGVESTLHFLKKAGIPHFGAGMNYNAAIEPHIVNIGGVSIGLVCASDFNYSSAKKNFAGSAPLNSSRLIKQVEELKKSCQHAIVVLHADEEFKDFPSPYRIRLSRRLIDAGADAVIQHHPHVIQGVEVYKGRTIAYSLGNWFFNIGEYQSSSIQSRFGVFFILDLPLVDGELQNSYAVHTMIDDLHRPVPLPDKEAHLQKLRLKKISDLLTNKRHIRHEWYQTCKSSISKESMNCYYILRQSGIKALFNRLNHLAKEPLFKREIIGLLTRAHF